MFYSQPIFCFLSSCLDEYGRIRRSRLSKLNYQFPRYASLTKRHERRPGSPGWPAAGRRHVTVTGPGGAGLASLLGPGLDDDDESLTTQ